MCAGAGRGCDSIQATVPNRRTPLSQLWGLRSSCGLHGGSHWVLWGRCPRGCSLCSPFSGQSCTRDSPPPHAGEAGRSPLGILKCASVCSALFPDQLTFAGWGGRKSGGTPFATLQGLKPRDPRVVAVAPRSTGLSRVWGESRPAPPCSSRRQLGSACRVGLVSRPLDDTPRPISLVPR